MSTPSHAWLLLGSVPGGLVFSQWFKAASSALEGVLTDVVLPSIDSVPLAYSGPLAAAAEPLSSAPGSSAEQYGGVEGYSICNIRNRSSFTPGTIDAKIRLINGY